jgi:hypothetical protein
MNQFLNMIFKVNIEGVLVNAFKNQRQAGRKRFIDTSKRKYTLDP